MRKIITVLGCLASVLALLIFIFFSNKSPFPEYKTKNILINGHNIKLYVADNEIKRNQGLSGIKMLNKNEGMLFVFDQKGRYQFWMKDMYIDLDFIFLNGNKVVDVIKDVPHDSYPKIYQGKDLYDSVIELSADSDIDYLNLKKIDIYVNYRIRIGQFEQRLLSKTKLPTSSSS